MASALAVSLAGLALLAGTAYVSYKIQWWALIPSLVLCAAAFSFSFGGQSTANLITPIVIGTGGGLVFRKNAGLDTYVLAVTLILTLFMSGNYYYQLEYKNIDMLEVSRTELARVLEQNSAPEDLRQSMLSDFDSNRETIGHILPFLFFLNALFLSLLAHVGMKVFVARYGNSESVSGIEKFRLKDFMIVALILGLGAFLLVDRADFPRLYSLGLNVMLVSAVLYAMQALGVIKFMIVKRGLPRYLFPLLLLILIIPGVEVLVFASVLLAGLGTLDFWADFRKLGTNKDFRSEK